MKSRLFFAFTALLAWGGTFCYGQGIPSIQIPSTQSPSIQIPSTQLPEILPRYLTAEERALLPNYTPPAAESITPPPSFPVRNMAEWEEVAYLVIAWTGFPYIQSQIVDAAQEECTVLICCADSNSVKSVLSSYNVPLNNVEFLETSYNSIWLRDYFANSVYRDDVDSLYLVDWIYNRPRPLDDALPAAVANHLGLQMFTMTEAPNDLVNTGGNYMSDGWGRAFASELVIEENGVNGSFNITNKTEAQIDTIMKHYMGVEPYIKMDALPYDIINHIDMHMKLLNEHTLLVGEFPTNLSDGPQIEANLQYVFSNYSDHWGLPFDLKRIPMPSSSSGAYPPSAHYRTYSNSIFINKTILVPTYTPQFDTTALRLYNEYLPGYNVVPINCQDIIPLAGALHCITHTIGVMDPLLISHRAQSDQFFGTLGGGSGSFVSLPQRAVVKHRSGVQSVTLHFSVDSGASFQTIPMMGTGNPDEYEAVMDLPANNGVMEVQYYISAVAQSGKSQTRPMPALQGGAYRFELEIQMGMSEAQWDATRIYPNPAQALTCIEIPRRVAENFEIYLLDAQGRRVSEIHSGYSDRRHFFFDAANLSSGTYFVKIVSSSSQRMFQVLVEH